MSANKALIFGVSGQDGTYLSDYLLSLGYEVLGVSLSKPKGFNRYAWYCGDICDESVVYGLTAEFLPTEIYNLAAISSVGYSFRNPAETFNVNTIGAVNALGAARKYNCKIFQASTAEIFGPSSGPQSESSPFNPKSPYACSKLASFLMGRNYRDTGVKVSNGILFPHTSPIQSEAFFPSKVAHAVAKISKGEQDKLILGNLEAYRDWGYAGDYVRAMHLSLSEPGDYVIGSGQFYSLKKLLKTAFSYVGLDWHDYVEVSEELKRPADPVCLWADPTKIKGLGWKPTMTFEELISGMVGQCL